MAKIIRDNIPADVATLPTSKGGKWAANDQANDGDTLGDWKQVKQLDSSWSSKTSARQLQILLEHVAEDYDK